MRFHRRWPASALAAAMLAAACASAPKARPPAPAPPLGASVKVRPGESACAAAGRLGVSVEALRAANALRGAPEQPLGEQSLRIPAAPLEHRIEPGQTLGRVADWYGQPTEALADANHLADPDRIVAGERLRIPAGARTGCPPPAAVARARAPAAVSAAPPAKTAPRSPPPAAAAPPPELLARADDRLDSASRRYDGADFREAIALARSAAELLAAQPAHPAVVDRRARAAWLRGLAYAGLDEREDAARALREALSLRPGLRDDPRLSPRIAPLLGPPATAAGREAVVVENAR
jgi:LysM repeat protein